MRRSHRLFLSWLWTLFLPFSVSSQSVPVRSLSLQAGIYRSAPLELERGYTVRENVYVRSGPSIGFEGQVKYRRALTDDLQWVAGLGIGGYAYDLRIFSAGEFSGLGRDAENIGGPQFTIFHLLASLGAEYRLFSNARFELGAGVALHGGYFPLYRFSYTFFGTTDDGRDVGIFRTRFFFNPHNRLFAGLKVYPYARWQLSRQIGLMASVAKVFTGFQPIEDAEYFLIGRDETLPGKMSHLYNPLGLELEFLYSF